MTLGEVLAVLAVTISGLTLWNNWSERQQTAATRAADAHQASAKAARLVLMAGNTTDERLTLRPASAEQSIQSQKLSFPTALGLGPVETTGEARIETAWFDRALNKARNAAGLPDDSRGDEQLPVVITTSFLVDGKPHEDIAIYDVGYTISGRWLAGHSVALRGVSLVSRVTDASAQAKLDSRWRKSFSKPDAAR